MFGRKENNRKRERQLTRWMQDVTSTTGRNHVALKETALDRTMCREITYEVTSGYSQPDGH